MKTFKRFIALLLVLFCSFTTIASADNSSDFHSSIKKLLETVLENSVIYRIEGNDSGYIICVSIPGIMDGIAAVMVGAKPRETWESFVNVTLDFVNSLQEFIEVCQVPNPNILYVLMDDCGFNIPLLVICNGEVVYDYVPY